jgi:hypothetical protein
VLAILAEGSKLNEEEKTMVKYCMHILQDVDLSDSQQGNFDAHKVQIAKAVTITK